MTVQDLIDELMQVEDKNKPITIPDPDVASDRYVQVLRIIDTEDSVSLEDEL